ncbi:MAG: DNA-binding beta-propeller fold protein YncE [Myxococcota bacterium]|jgi:DNA-binding beta-propeller fold protein YncE
MTVEPKTKTLFVMSGILLALAACTPEVARTTFHLEGPVDMVVVCRDAKLPQVDGAPVRQPCEDETAGTLTGYVINSQRGSMARLNLYNGDFFDDDAFIPGLSAVPVGGRPSSVVVDSSGDADILYVSNVASKSIIRIDAGQLGGTIPVAAVVTQGLPGRPTDMILAGGELLVALTDEATVARIPLAEFGTATTLQNIPLVGGSPYSLAATADAATLYVGHADNAWVSVVDLVSGAETAQVPMADACFDGLDNNGDGLADTADWGCRWSSTGVESEMPVGWVAPEIPTLPGDALDLPRCMNGVDDDGDGAADFPDDPDCLGPTSTLETPWAGAPVLARVALSPEGGVLYALNRRSRTLVVIDTATNTRVDVNAQDQAGANRLFRRLGRKDIQLNGVPLDIAFMRPELSNTDTVEDLEDTWTPLRAYVSSTTGKIAVIEAEDNDNVTRNWLFDDDETLLSIVVQEPRLFRGAVELVLGGNRRSDQPSMGEFLRETLETIDGTDEITYYSVRVNQDEPRVARGETWAVSHGGAILERTAKRGAVDFATGDFVTPEALFCTSGVEAGDHVQVKNDPPAGCDAFPGRAFLFTTTSVNQWRLGLDAGGGWVMDVPVGADPQSRCNPSAPTDFELTEDEREQLGPSWPGCSTGTECVFGRCRATVPAMTEACFGDAMAYSIHVPQGTSSVTGSTSGYLHAWTADELGVCVQDATATDFVGRTTEWALAIGDILPSCPVSNSEADGLMSGPWFANHAITLRMMPGCVLRGATQTVMPTATEFDVRWELGVDSSFGAREIGGRTDRGEITLGNPRRLVFSGVGALFYAVDAGQEKVVEILAGIDTIRRAFF